jgi:hypothetical protein
MWLKARCLALLEGQLPDAYAVKVAFKLPVQLPAKVGVAFDRGRLAMHDAANEKPHLEGTVEHEQG